jgi:putative transposase
MKKNTPPIKCGEFYHIYNRGINGEDVFKEERNYTFFLKRYAEYVSPVAKTYAYCLLKNHFHLLIQTRYAEEILLKLNHPAHSEPDEIKRITAAEHCISNQFAKCLNSYAQSINKSLKRTGSLFERPFRRAPVLSEAYFTELVFYIHANPVKHRFESNLTKYPHSSYHALLSNKPTKLERTELLDWFGSVQQFERFHLETEELRFEDAFSFDE